MEAPKINDLKEFLNWLYEQFNVPESSQFERSKEYATKLPKNCNFEHLRNCILKEWRSKHTLPTINWLNYRIQPDFTLTTTVQKTEEYLQKEREHAKEVERHRPELIQMMQRDLNEWRKRWGKPIKEYNQCF